MCEQKGGTEALCEIVVKDTHAADLSRFDTTHISALKCVSLAFLHFSLCNRTFMLLLCSSRDMFSLLTQSLAF